MMLTSHTFSISILLIFSSSDCLGDDVHPPKVKVTDTIRDPTDSVGRWAYKFEDSIAVYAIKGNHTAYMEDNYLVMLLENGIKTSLLGFGVFDGHGGTEASHYAATKLIPKIFEKYYSQKISSTAKGFWDPLRHYLKGGSMNMEIDRLTRYLSSTVETFDQNMLEKGNIPLSAGTTAVFGVLDEPMLYIGNVGDSRAIATTTNPPWIDRMSIDHKPDWPGEQSRILRNGAKILRKGHNAYAKFGDYSIGMSRSLGDKWFKKRGIVIAKPYINATNLDKAKYDYLILASDGLWDVMLEDEAVSIVNPYFHSDHLLIAAKTLAEAASEKTMDDVTVMIVKLPKEDVVAAAWRNSAPASPEVIPVRPAGANTDSSNDDATHGRPAQKTTGFKAMLSKAATGIKKAITRSKTSNVKQDNSAQRPGSSDGKYNNADSMSSTADQGTTTHQHPSPGSHPSPSTHQPGGTAAETSSPASKPSFAKRFSSTAAGIRSAVTSRLKKIGSKQDTSAAAGISGLKTQSRRKRNSLILQE